MGLKIFCFSLFLLLSASCSFENSEPERLDPIYSDLEKEFKATSAQIAAAQKELDGFLTELEAVKPQTGQIKYAQKRVSDAQQKLEHLKQMNAFWKLRVASRLAWDREHYLLARKEKTPWPPPEEYKEFKAQMALENAPKNWNLRQRLEQAKLGIKLKNNPGEHGSSDPDAAGKPEH